MLTKKLAMVIWISLTAIRCVAQTSVTTGGGTTGTIPVFTGSATLGNSVITQQNSNVGIGTASPSSPLSISGSGNGQTLISLSNSSASQYTQMSYVGTGRTYLTGVGNASETGYGLANKWYLFDGSVDAVRMVADSSGNVGVGTTTPQAKLQVSDTAKLYSSVGSEFDSNVEIQGSYAGKAIGQGPALGFISPANTDGSNLWEMARILSSPDNVNSSDANGRMYLQTRYANAGSWYWNNNLVLTSSGNVGIGTTGPGARLEISGNVKLTAGSGASMTFQDGSVQSVAWNGVLSGGDYAESVDVIGDRAEYEPGDVLVIDPASKSRFMKSAEAYSTAVMGIYSTRPGVVGRRQKTDKSHMKEEVPMAMVGVVPTKVSVEGGAIKPGDLLVTSSKPGYAMKGSDRSLLTGAIIGKALEPLDAGTGVIEVAVSIQ